MAAAGAAAGAAGGAAGGHPWACRQQQGGEGRDGRRGMVRKVPCLGRVGLGEAGTGERQEEADHRKGDQGKGDAAGGRAGTEQKDTRRGNTKGNKGPVTFKLRCKTGAAQQYRSHILFLFYHSVR